MITNYEQSERHKVFLSYYHKDDERWREKFEESFSPYFINKSVKIGDIDPDNSALYTKRLIMEKYITDTSVLIVLIGPHTWGRKHVDWEISAALNYKVGNHYAGLMGLILPTHASYRQMYYDESIVPPRLVANQRSGYARIYDWTYDADTIKGYVQTAFDERKSKSHLRVRGAEQFARNKSGSF